jgi:hypothetical protein
MTFFSKKSSSKENMGALVVLGRSTRIVLEKPMTKVNSCFYCWSCSLKNLQAFEERRREINSLYVPVLKRWPFGTD